MTYDEFVALITDSDPDEWHVLSGVYPPLLKSVGGNDDLDMFSESHYNAAFYRPDIDVSLAWGLPQNRGEPWGPGHGGWGENFPDSHVYGVYVDLRWRGQIIERELICSVDGGRYYVPLLDGDAPDGGWGSGNPVTRWKLRPDRIPLARLVHDVQGTMYDFDEGLRIAGAVVVDY